jgi:hypothetical protein
MAITSITFRMEQLKGKLSIKKYLLMGKYPSLTNQDHLIII